MKNTVNCRELIQGLRSMELCKSFCTPKGFLGLCVSWKSPVANPFEVFQKENFQKEFESKHRVLLLRDKGEVLVFLV